MKEEFDFVGIGDVVTDAFVDLDSVKIVKDPNGGTDQMCMNYGDKIPFNWHKIIKGVGNSANASVSATRLGLNTAFISNVGKDRVGDEQLDALKENGINTEFVEQHEGQDSNYHYVILHKADRTILVKHTEFDYKLPDIGKPKWIYLSSLAQNSLPYHQEIGEFLENTPETKLAFQPGTFQMNLGYEKLKSIYQNSTLFFCNVEEAVRILEDALGGVKKDFYNMEEESGRAEGVKMLLEKMNSLGVKLPVITDGPGGAYAMEDNKVYFVPMYPDPKQPIDRTGAGDSFSSTFTAIYAETGDVKEALKFGPINSMNVVQYVGAQEGLQTREQIEEHLKNAPDFYKVQEI